MNQWLKLSYMYPVIVISFNNCTFKNNYATFVVSIMIDKFMDFACQDSQIATFPSSLFFRESQFIYNKGKILLVRDNRSKKQTFQ